MRMTLVISSLGAGGAERVMSILANYWAEYGHDVTIITLSAIVDDFYPLHPKVRRIGLAVMRISSGLGEAVANNLRRVKYLRKEIRATCPEFVLSFIDTTNVLTLAACLGLRIPVIASEHIDPRYHYNGPVWAGLRRLLYPRAAAVVVLTEGVRSWAEGLVKRHRVHVIPNPVSVTAVERIGKTGSNLPGGTIAAMGRLVPQKGFDILLKAFARCTRSHPEWSLVILGEGRERECLEELIVQLGIKGRVSMPGQSRDPFLVLSAADIFVLSSRYEGFPMALVEAMACGLPVIAADCPSGPREIIRNDVDGRLVPPCDVPALAMELDRLMTNSEERHRLGARAIEVRERFNIERVIGMWEKVVMGDCRTARS